MRAYRVLGVLAVAAFAVAGCGKGGVSWVDPLGTKRPNEWTASTHVIRPTQMAGPSLGRAQAYRAEFERAAVRRDARGKIERRIQDDLRAWEASVAEAADSAREHEARKQAEKKPNGAATKPPPAPFDPEDLAAARRDRSVEVLNAQLRVAILQSRLDAASEVERAAITTKLDEAKSALRAVDSACEDRAALIKTNRTRASENGNGDSGKAGATGE